MTKPFTWPTAFSFDYDALSDADKKAYAEGFLRQFWKDDRLKEIDLLSRIAEEADTAGLAEIARRARNAADAIEHLIEAIEARTPR